MLCERCRAIFKHDFKFENDKKYHLILSTALDDLNYSLCALLHSKFLKSTQNCSARDWEHCPVGFRLINDYHVDSESHYLEFDHLLNDQLHNAEALRLVFIKDGML